MNLIHIYNYYSSIWKCSIFRTLGFFTLSLDILEACPLRVIRVKQTTIGRVRPWIGDLEWNYWVILNKVKTTPPCFYSNLSHRLAHWEFSQITDPQLYENLRRFLSLPILCLNLDFIFASLALCEGHALFKINVIYFCVVLFSICMFGIHSIKSVSTYSSLFVE